MPPTELSEEARKKLESRIEDLLAQIEDNESNQEWETAIINSTALLEILPVMENSALINVMENRRKEFEEKHKKQCKDQDNALREQYEKNYRHLSSLIPKIEARKQWEQGIDYCNKILPTLVPIGKEKEINQWWNYRNQFVSNLQTPELKEKYEINYKKYPDFLREANELESKFKEQARQLLSYCLALILANEEDFLKNFPKRKADKQNLLTRLQL